MRIAGAVALALISGGCAAATAKQLRFAEHPYCTVVADGTHYRFHHDQRASSELAAAAARWPHKQVRLRNAEPVEFKCLRSVQQALARAGKVADFATDK